MAPTCPKASRGWTRPTSTPLAPRLLSPAGGYETGTLLQLQASSSSLAAALAPVTAVKVYQCSDGCSDDCYNYVAVVKNTPCRLCHGPMNEPMEVVGSSDPSSGGHGEAAAEDGQGQAPDAVLAGMGFVQVVVTYTIMDDLAVAPMSTISGIAVLRGFGVTDLGSLQEKAVRVGYNEGVEMLRASLQSKTVLTDVFLRKNMGKDAAAARSNSKKLKAAPSKNKKSKKRK
ncbi:hypothetical protein HU200_031201 [Digitaria exilis]|uniref:Uncharacterized protein n=1 Tax=Digitaria exilis TaxID=1010633 RepID=A0A835EQE1_9POAL|nr:hypothetical protein HU200_031201 [Digitaria exilis]